jgi:hypothetical protein
MPGSRWSSKLETGLDGRVFDVDGDTVSGLYAVGNAARLAEGGMHGHGSLEGTSRRCLFTGLKPEEPRQKVS